MLLSIGIAAATSLIGFLVGSRMKHRSSLTANASDTEDRFRLLTDHMAASVILRSVSGEILFCSPFTEVLSGYPVQSFLAEPDFFESVIHPDDKDHYRRSMQVVLLGEAYQFRYRFIHRSGIEMWGETRVVPIIDETGETTATLAITLDVTGPVRYQKQVESRNRELQDFSYMISHDLKSPIYTIKGMLGIIRDDFSGKLDPELKEIIDHIQKAHGRLESLVTGILEYSRATSENITQDVVALDEILKEVTDDYTTSLKDIGGSIQLSTEDISVLGNKTKLYQVFSNLIGNAVKYRNPNAPLWITISMTIASTSKRATVVLKDNGLGISVEKLPEIFRPFQRAHGHTEGTGVGLAIVSTLVDRMGGEISASSVEGDGSEFRVTLQIA